MITGRTADIMGERYFAEFLYKRQIKLYKTVTGMNLNFTPFETYFANQSICKFAFKENQTPAREENVFSFTEKVHLLGMYLCIPHHHMLMQYTTHTYEK